MLTRTDERHGAVPPPKTEVSHAANALPEQGDLEDRSCLRRLAGGASRRIVAIPARNEAERIADCLHALADQQDRAGAPLAGDFCVLLLVNNSDDGTAEIARALAADMPYALDVLEMTLIGADASAGGARRIVMAEAARRMREAGANEGFLLTTDADTRVPPRWMADISAVLESGTDAVAGSLRLDAADEACLPAALKRRGAMEGRYEALLCELESILDPKPWDPWPRHNNEPGASLALTLSSFLAVGGIPPQALGEDRALCDALRSSGYRIRHTHEAAVTTSGRLIGRAPGGCADTMRLRIAEPNARCDPYLQPIWSAVRRFRLNRINGSARYPRSPGLRPGSLRWHIFMAEQILRLLTLFRTGRAIAPMAPHGTSVPTFQAERQSPSVPAV